MLRNIRVTLLSLILLLSALFWLMVTTQGASVLIKTLSALIPGTCKMHVASGNLMRGIHITDLHMRNIWVNVDADAMLLSWSLKPSSLQHFIITRAQIIHLRLARPHEHDFLQLNTLIVTAHHDKAIVTWDLLNLPLAREFDLYSHNAIIHLQGKWLLFRAQGDLDLGGTEIPETTWHVNATGGVLGFIQVTASSQALKGNMQLQGQVHWIPPITWQGHLQAEKIDLNLFHPQIPATIDLALSSNGYFQLHEPLQAQVAIEKLSGRLDGNPINASGNFAINNHYYLFNQIHFQSGQALLNIQGQYGAKTDLTWQLNIPQLKDLLKQGQGQLQSQGAMQSYDALRNLSGQANLQVNQFCYPPYCLANANIQVNMNTIAAAKLNISMQNLTKDQQTLIKQANIRINTQKNQGMLSADLLLEKQKLILQALGKWQDSLLHLTLSQANLNGGLVNIQLKTPLLAEVSKEHLNIQPICLAIDTGQMCIKQFNLARDTSGTLTGTIDMDAPNLQWLSAISPTISQSAGHAQLTLHIATKDKKPLLSGKMQLDNGQVSLPAYGLTLRPIQMVLNLDNNHFNYKLHLNSDPGELAIEGEGDLNPFAAKLSAKGQHLTVYNNRDAKILVSPDLTLTLQTDKVDVTGQVTIPEASITPKDFTSTVRLPNDVVWVDDSEHETTNWQFSNQINIVLGDKIHIDYAGLKAQLGGHLTLKQSPDGGQTATGMITIPHGQFKAYGQDLTIRDGAIIYTGGVLDNPGLDIQAIRHIQSFSSSTTKNTSVSTTFGSAQIVGVKVSGTLNDPKLTMFSEPPGLNQADILSYLVLGRPSDQASSNQTALLMNAFSFLNIGGNAASQFSSQINKAFGLDEFTVGSQQEYNSADAKVVDNTSVILGKTFTPRLYVNYSIGLLEPINVLQITYKLTQRVQLQSEHSTNSNGVDLFYTWQR